MTVNGKIICLIGCALLLSIDSFSRTIYVSEKSDGNGNGNIDKPPLLPLRLRLDVLKQVM